MDFLLVTVLFVGIFVGYNAQPAGNLNFVCRNEEEYNMCRSPCEPTCDSVKSGIKVNCTQSCVAGCFCRDGFVRASDKTCVSPEECIKRTIPECKENEDFLECGSPCVVNCSNINDPIICTQPCRSGCFCKPHFVRDSKGNCVHPRNCNNAGYGQCPMNEHYVRCVNFCNTCWESGDCRGPYCTPGCDCKSGFYRNTYGRCVTIEECLAPLYDSSYPGNCGENEIYSDCVNLCNDCVSRGTCNYEFFCESGCDCKPGYFRNERGICVPEHFCFKRCNEDQIFNHCGPSCVSTCENYKRLQYHPCKHDCVSGCFCPGNFVSGPNGRCIQPKYCPAARPPSCPPGEAFYQCLPTCRTTCETLNISSGICFTECKPGCFCQPGFVRNKDGICVLPKECPEPVRSCPAGEVYYDCIPTCRNTCDNWNLPKPCIEICNPGCFCRRGFVRNRDGKCVRPRNCPIICRTNEEFLSCGSPCPDTCSNLHKRTPCIERCARGCFCKPGFVLGPNNRCIKSENCPVNLATNESVSFYNGRRGTDNDAAIDETTTIPSVSTESTQSVTNKPTQSDISSLSGSTKLSTLVTTDTASTSTVSPSEATDSTSVSTVSPSEATDLASAATVSPSAAIDLASSTTDLAFATTNLTSDKVVTFTNTDESKNHTAVETTTIKLSPMIPNESTLTKDTTYTTSAPNATETTDGQNQTGNFSVITTHSGITTSANSTA